MSELSTHVIIQRVIIQGDSGGKVSILGCDSTDIVRKKVHMNVCLILNRYRHGAA